MAQTGTNFSILGRHKKVSQLHSEAMTSLNRVVLFADETFLGSTKPFESFCIVVCATMQTDSGHLLTLKYCKRMAKKVQKIKKGERSELLIVNPNATGIAVACTEYQVCVTEDRDQDPNRRFDSKSLTTFKLAKILVFGSIGSLMNSL